MDIDKLIEAIRLCGSQPDVRQCRNCAYYTGGDMGACIPEMTAQAAEALSALRGENDRLHEQIEDARLEGYAKGLGELTSELEQVKREYHQRLELDGIACKYCACYTDGCVQNDEEAEFCELWQWRGLKERDVDGQKNP